MKEENPLHFLEFGAYADGDAAAVATLEDTDLTVQDMGSKSVEYLTIEDRALRKRALYFFLPRIMPDEPSPRKVRIDYRWPNLMWRIPEEGHDDFSFRTSHKLGMIHCLNITIQVSNSLSDPGVAYLGAGIEGFSPPEKEIVEGYCQYAYSTTNAPAGGTRYQFRVSTT